MLVTASLSFLRHCIVKKQMGDLRVVWSIKVPYISVRPPSALAEHAQEIWL